MSQAPTVTASLPRTLRLLSRSLARRCRGSTVVVGRGWPELVSELQELGLEVAVLGLDTVENGVASDMSGPGPNPAAGDGEGFDTVLLARALEYESAGARSRLLQRAWRLVSADGRLLVCVPNAHASDGAGASSYFDRRQLKRLLQQIDRPRVMTDQPYAWLVMSIDARPRLGRTTRQRHKVIARLCREPVLELGCAQGHLCKTIADRGLSVTGVDKSPLKISRARTLFPGIPFVEADILDLPLARGYGAVVLAEVLEHVLEEVGDRLLSKAWDLVTPGGRLIVSVPNEDCVPHPNHVRCFRSQDLTRMLRPLGRPRLVTEQPFKWLLMYVDRAL